MKFEVEKSYDDVDPNDYEYAEGVVCEELVVMDDGKFTKEGIAHMEKRRQEKLLFEDNLRKAVKIVEGDHAAIYVAGLLDKIDELEASK